MKKYLLALLSLAVLAVPALAFASPFDINWSLQDSGDSTTPYNMNIPGSQYGYGDFYLLGVGTNGTDYQPHVVNAGDQIQWNGTKLIVENVPEDNIAGLDGDLSTLASEMNSATSSLASLSTTVSGLSGGISFSTHAFGSSPVVTTSAEDATSGANTNVQITAKSSTSVTVHVNRITSALGILSLNSTPSGVVVDLVAVQP